MANAGNTLTSPYPTIQTCNFTAEDAEVTEKTKGEIDKFLAIKLFLSILLSCLIPNSHKKFQVDHPRDHGEDQHGIAGMHPDGENGVFFAGFSGFFFIRVVHKELLSGITCGLSTCETVYAPHCGSS
jgi:hypothetical protein